ncbi:MAG TPA: hypothetical protein VGP15_14700 [Burkholderiales bacterium]|nr:hypothetical protein [Burkholderiales bacterium]
MAKQFSAVLAAAAGVALISISASTYAGGEQNHPLSVNDTGPVLTAQQQQYEQQLQSKREAVQGVAGRPGYAMDNSEGRGDVSSVEIKTPSRGGPIDD